MPESPERLFYSSRLAVACDVVREVGALALASFRDPALRVEQKGVQNYVTMADRAVEALIVSRLRVAFPDDAFLSEEGGALGGASTDSATCDGTSNYARGLPLWCVSVALVHAGDIALGLIFNPVSDEFYCAVRGRGAFCNELPIRVSGTGSPEQARLGIGFSYRRSPSLHIAAIKRLLGARCEYSRLGSGALGLAFVADGRFMAIGNRTSTHGTCWRGSAWFVKPVG